MANQKGSKTQHWGAANPTVGPQNLKSQYVPRAYVLSVIFFSVVDKLHVACGF